MYNPEKILTKSGFEEYKAHIFNIKNAIFFICNHADDLHIGNKDIEILENALGLMETGNLFTGDGEEHEQ